MPVVGKKVLPTSLQDKLKKIKPRKRDEPLWKGPEEDGVTFSMLSRFLSCRERFRLLVVEGWKPADKFEPRIEYGNMWHACEEALASRTPYVEVLRNYAMGLVAMYPEQREDIAHWHGLVAAFFPLYVRYWKSHDDVKQRTPLMQEEVFQVPYSLPSGRVVKLRGKWDSVDMIGKKPDVGIYIQENKSKSRIYKADIERQVSFDLQSMLYVVALSLSDNGGKRNIPIKGFRYNVVRRPAHKTVESALKKYQDDEKANRLEEWFCRWKVEVSPEDIKKFCIQCLDPILEQLCDWWDVVKYAKMAKEDIFTLTTSDGGPGPHVHFRFPYGVYNPIAEGGTGDLDHLMDEGSTAGLRQVETLFPELENHV